MGIYVDLITEVRARLVAAQAIGQPLAGVKHIIIGPRQLQLNDNDLPLILVQIERGDEDAKSSQLNKIATMEIKITIIDKSNTTSLDTSTKTYFDTDSGDGILYTFEKMLDILDKNVAGAVHPRLGVNATGTNVTSFNFVHDSNRVIIEATIRVQSAQFQFGARSV